MIEISSLCYFKSLQDGQAIQRVYVKGLQFKLYIVNSSYHFIHVDFECGCLNHLWSKYAK